MKKLLIFVDWFLPGYKAGGQIQSCANLAYALKDEVEVYVVTSDRDLGDEHAYPSVIPDEWNMLENNLRVMYLSPGNRTLSTMRSIIRSVAPRSIYLNCMYSFRFTILPIEAGIRSSKARIVLAPRGMLHEGALQYKRLKKKLYFNLFRIRGLHKKIVFHATDSTEQEDVKKVFGKDVHIEFVKDFPSSRQGPLQVIKKEPGTLKCIFVSRISPKKNLLFLLSVLSTVKAGVQLSIVGPVEDDQYWIGCREMITSLPSNIKVEYMGAIPNSELPAVYRQHHLFVLATHGENFGHVIFESLLNGRPVLISDLTPWRNLEEKETGWDIPLTEKDKFREKIELAAGWHQEQFNRHCDASWHFAQAYITGSALKQQYLKLFS